MANGRNPISGTFEDVRESVVKPVMDEVGKALETGVTSVVQGPQQNPQDAPKKEEDRQKKLAAWRWRLEQLRKLEESQRKVREEAKQKEMQKAQVVQAEKQKGQAEEFEIFKKKGDLNLKRAQRKTEIKTGVGG